MEQNEQEQRSSAAKDFQDSLDQLQHLLEEDPIEEQLVQEAKMDKATQKQVVEDSLKFDLADWEDAVADIEQYLESKNQED
ncbi:MAG: hypothetical protein AAF915_14495 [Cyanobacteria bacterium P01_D01_bin.50]